MGDVGQSHSGEPAKWDAEFTRRLINAVRPVAKRWFRWEVDGLESFPPDGGALVVSNHSGGMLTADTLIFSTAFYDRFDYERPVLILGHDALFAGSLASITNRIGLIRADREIAVQALRSGAVVMVFPGGVYDAYRSTLRENRIDFKGRIGYVRIALAAGVPIVPVVSTGGQQSQLFLTRGTWLAKRLGLKRFRSDILPVSFGFPFGVSVIVPVNLPLPTKIVTKVLEPVDVAARFGPDPDVEVVDAHVRSVMQAALHDLGRRRRLPVVG
jgi:1-acyl-sn-glycerol-3-phosphate acyltransferase